MRGHRRHGLGLLTRAGWLGDGLLRRCVGLRPLLLSLAMLPGLLLLLRSCGRGELRLLPGSSLRLNSPADERSPSLGGRWLALISNQGGRDLVRLFDLHTNRPVPLPGLNRLDALPVAVSTDARGRRLALIRQLAGRTELLLYDRGLAALQRLPLDNRSGVPRNLALSGDGRQLAVQLERGGRWQVEVLKLP